MELHTGDPHYEGMVLRKGDLHYHGMELHTGALRYDAMELQKGHLHDEGSLPVRKKRPQHERRFTVDAMARWTCAQCLKK